MRRTSVGLILPMLLICTDFQRAAWAFRVDHARRAKLIEVAKKQGLDPEMLLDPIGYQKKEAERAKVRRAKAVKEAEELSKPDPVKLAAADKERAAVRKAYAPVELASIAKDLEGLRTTLAQLHSAAGDRRKTDTALNSIDGYARILSDAHEVLARYDAAERERLATLPAQIRARHDRFMRDVQPLVKNVRDGLDDLVKTKSTRNPTAIALVEQKLARLRPAPARPVAKGFALHPAKFIATAPRNDPEQIRKIAPRVMTPKEFDLMNKALHSPSGGGIHGIFKVPSFLIALLSGPGTTDLAATDEAPLSDEIVAKASALGHDPIQIFNFVHDNIVTEVYYGSKKGARGTLAEMAGNDFDQASLLIALLRASGLPARYELGTVTLTPEQAMGFTGTETPAAAASALVSSGFPAQQLATGNTVTGVQMELTWVRAYVPYTNYRGIGVAPAGQGSVWAHLAPSIKRYRAVDATNLIGRVPFDFEAYLSHEQPKSPVDTWEDQVRAYLQANPALNCTTLDSAQKKRIPIADQLPLLPETLPVQVAQRLAVFSDVPATFKHTVEIVASSSGGASEIDYSASVAALYGKPLAVQFDPATPADAATLTAHGGLDNTPAYLVQLRPVLYSADLALATGPVGDTPGLNQSWQLHFNVPNLAPEDPRAHTLSVGGVYALVLDAGTLPGSLVDSAAQLEQDLTSAGRSADFIAAAHLSTLGRRYFADFDRGRDHANGLYWSRYFKDTYEGSFGLTVRAQSVNGVPVSVKRNLVDIDVVRLTTTPFAVDGNNVNSAAITRLTGHNSSFLEHSTPQAFYGANQWSAVRLLQNAAQNGQTIFHIDSTSLDATLARIAVPDAVAADIRDQVLNGRTVRIHSLPITPPNLPSLWGYIPEDLSTGEGAFRINAILSGGVGDISTAEEQRLQNCPKCLAALAKVHSEVEASDGTYSFDEKDLSVLNGAFPAIISRTYRSSNSLRPTMLGPGWRQLYDAQLVFGSDGSIVLLDQLGRPVRFTLGTSGDYEAEPGYHAALIQDVDSSWQLSFTNGILLRFDNNGYLVREEDPNGSALQLVRDGSGRLTSAVDKGGRLLLSFAYGGRGTLDSVSDMAGRSVHFEYDTLDRLSAVIDVLGNRKTYAYDGNDRLVAKSDYRGNITSIAYDASGRWRRAIDPVGNATTAVYDPAGAPAVITDAVGGTTTFGFDASGARTSVTDALGNKTSYVYDVALNITQASMPGGQTFAGSYDGHGNLLSGVDAAGNRTTYSYGAFDRLTSLIDAAGQTTTRTYDGAGNLLSVTDPGGLTTQYTYDAGLVKTITNPEGGRSLMEYGPSGNLASFQDPDGNKTTIQFDAAGHPVSAVEANGAAWRMAVDAKGRVRNEVDPVGRQTSYEYDSDGNRIGATDPAGNKTVFQYDSMSRLIATTDPQGNTTQLRYDAASRLLSTTESDGARITYTYDVLGRFVSKVDVYGAEHQYAFCADKADRPCQDVDAVGNVTKLEYNNQGKVVGVVDALGHRTQYQLDSLGRRESITDAAGKVTRLRYDAYGHVTEIQDPLGHSISYSYNSRGQRTAIIDSGNHETIFGYSLGGRLLSETNALGVGTTYAYDAVGNITAKTYGDGHQLSYSYDLAKHLLAITGDDGSQSLFAYDDLGRILQATNAETARSFAYDQYDRIVKVTDQRTSRSLTYGYDAIGNRQSVSDSDGNQTTYKWDLARRLREVVDPDGEATRFQYDAAGRRTSAQYTNGLIASYNYDANSLLLNATWSSRDAVIQSFSYSRDLLGRVTSKQLGDGTGEDYSYDDAGRLSSVTGSSGTNVDYEYDPDGNRLRQVRSSGSSLEETLYSYNALDQLTSAQVGGVSASTFEYDARGNQTRRVEGSNATTFSYDLQNQLRELGTNQGAIRWAYDPFGQRIGIQDMSGSRDVLWDADSEYAEFDQATGAALVRYDRDPTTQDAWLGQKTAAGKHRFVTDLLGSPYELVDAAGAVSSEYRYDVFGARSAVRESVPTSIGFTGRPIAADAVTYHRERFLQQDLGRWNRLDPGGFVDGPNRYAYVRGSPASATDPTGRFYWFLAAIGMAAFASEAAFILFVGAATFLAVAVIAYLVGLEADSLGNEAFSTGAMNIANAGYEAFTVAITLGMISQAVGQLGPPGGGPPCRKQADQIMQDTADDADSLVAQGGRPPWIRGTLVHHVADRLIKTYPNPEGVELNSEVSYLNGRVVPWGTPGSVRHDAVFGPVDEPIAVYNIKTGGAHVTPDEVSRSDLHTPGAPPYLEVKPGGSGPKVIPP